MPKKREIIDDASHFAVQSYLNLRAREARDESRCYAAEGVRALLTAADSGIPVQRILYSPTLLCSGPARRAIKRLERGGAQTTRVTPELYRRCTTERRASGVAIVVNQTWTEVDDAVSTPALWLGVRHLRSAGNFGTLIRSVEAMGHGGVMLFGASMDPHDPDVVRSSMCAALTCRFVRTTHSNLADQAVRVVGAAVDGEPLHSVPLTGHTVVLLGHERHGLTGEERAMCDDLVRIPMLGRSSSLNAAVAGSIIAYEALRQRLSPS